MEVTTDMLVFLLFKYLFLKTTYIVVLWGGNCNKQYYTLNISLLPPDIVNPVVLFNYVEIHFIQVKLNIRIILVVLNKLSFY